jgi:triosephosphate isomerase
MTRRPFIAGNWKMNLHRAGAVELASALAERAETAGDIDLAVCPSAVYLEAVAGVVNGSRIALGAQNMHFEKAGAFTGEISGSMLVDLGCRYVILGHSERRHLLGETDELVNKKLHAALAVGLTPIVCLGETLAEREAGQTQQVIRRQFSGSLSGLTAEQADRLVIAYEPVWAIGTGRVATPQQAEAVHVELRKLLKERYNAAVADSVRIQYGGSVKPDNAVELLACQNIDGALVGGASLKADDFWGIVKAAAA